MILANGYFSTLVPIIPGRVIDGLSSGSMDMQGLLMQVGLLVGVVRRRSVPAAGGGYPRG